MYSLTDLGLYLLIYSFLGWVVEAGYYAVTRRQFCNRGVLSLPLILAYGVTFDLLILVLPTLAGHHILSFLAVIAEKCKEAGMQLLYHNHAHEFARTEEGGYQLDAFYEAAETAALAAELDLCWVKVGGADPAEYLRRYSGRCPLVHMKDFVRDGEVTLVALGDGELDVGTAAAQAAESGAKWLVVEQDDHHFGSPMENMKKSIDCLKKL